MPRQATALKQLPRPESQRRKKTKARPPPGPGASPPPDGTSLGYVGLASRWASSVPTAKKIVQRAGLRKIDFSRFGIRSVRFLVTDIEAWENSNLVVARPGIPRGTKAVRP